MMKDTVARKWAWQFARLCVGASDLAFDILGSKWDHFDRATPRKLPALNQAPALLR